MKRMRISLVFLLIVFTLFTSCAMLIRTGFDAVGSVMSASATGFARDLPQGSSKIGDFWVTGGPNNSAVIIRYVGDAKDVQIPAELEGVPITQITGYQIVVPFSDINYAGAFQSTGITSVIIPGSVTTIGKSAFSYNKLTSVIIQDGVTSIEAEAFRANDLSAITIPDSVTSIGDDAFNANRITDVIFPDGIKTIGAMAFANNQLTNITIPGSVTSIGRSAFIYNRLTTVIIPDSVTSVGDGAFSNNNQLTSIFIPFVSLLQADIAWGGSNWRRGVDQTVFVPTR
jgi:hypothetical protein